MSQINQTYIFLAVYSLQKKWLQMTLINYTSPLEYGLKAQIEYKKCKLLR